MISSSERLKVITLIDEARQSGARLKPCCQILNISERTYQRWVREGSSTKDKRIGAIRKPPANKLSTEEKREILSICNSSESVDLYPAQIVPELADKGCYIASESSFYRLLKELNQNAHRKPVKDAYKKTITTHIANGPNQRIGLQEKQTMASLVYSK